MQASNVGLGRRGDSAACVAPPVFAGQDDGGFWGPGMMMGWHFSEQRLAALKTELGITEAQAKAWDDYAAAIKTSTQSTRDAHIRLMGAPEPATLPERLQLSQEMMTARIESLKSANAATLALYAALNDEQKQKADELILGMGMM